MTPLSFAQTFLPRLFTQGRWAWAVLGILAMGINSALRADQITDFTAAPHNYWQRELHDPVTLALSKIQRGELAVDTSGGLPFLRSLLQALHVPIHSQLLVYSATSFQSGLIHPSNPRALYFNEDVYVGYVPGGRVELIGIDPEVGAVFYIFSPLSYGAVPAFERSTRCMNCHAGAETHHLPGLVAESVSASLSGGSLETYVHDETGHQIPLEQRFGGWHLTGGHHLAHHYGNLLGTLAHGQLLTQEILPGQMSDLRHYLAPTSDILPHLIHEHQIGFVDRVLDAIYLVRELEDKHADAAIQAAAYEDAANTLTRYVLFADEAALPSNGIVGDPAYAREFFQTRKVASNGLSLRDLDLRHHMFRHRCSYMIYTPLWAALPEPVKSRVYRQMSEALQDTGAPAAYAYLSPQEKRDLRVILKDTLPGWP